jgi:phosphoribosylanthranilate isomerase
MLKIKIKASDVTSLTDARYFAAKEVEWLCFNFTEGVASYIEPMKARAMIEWVEGVKIVGEFERATADEINFYTEGWGLELVQLGFLTPIETVQNIKNVGIIKEFIVEKFTNPDFLRKELSLFAPYVVAFQLSFDKGGISWEDLKSPSNMLTLDDLREIADEFNIILSINLELDMLDDVLEMNLYGLDIKGGEEERVGVKSFDELDEILEALEVVE